MGFCSKLIVFEKINFREGRVWEKIKANKRRKLRKVKNERRGTISSPEKAWITGRNEEKPGGTEINWKRIIWEKSAWRIGTKIEGRNREREKTPSRSRNTTKRKN